MTHKPLPMFDTHQVSAFWARVTKGDDCWLWAGSLVKGYGVFTGRRYLAHRVAYRLHFGIDPGPLFVCHHCDNPRCCRPDHLFLGTNQDNQRDCSRKARRSGEKHGNSKLCDVEVNEILRSSKSHAELGEQYGVTAEAIGVIRRRQAWKHIGTLEETSVSFVCKGENHGQSKLTNNDVHHIRMSNKTNRELAAHFGVSDNRIWAIRTGRAWKHLL